MLSPTTLALVFSLPLFFLALSRTPYESERIPLTPGQIDSTLLRADSFLMSCQIDSARVLYSAVRNEQKNSLRALIGLGRVALAERDWGEALDMAERVWRVDTANIPSHYLAAVAYRELGINKLLHSDWKSSRRQFEWIVERDSSFDDALYQFALLERYEGDLEHALELARAQTAKKPELEGPQLAVYKLYKYFMAVEDSADFLEWLRKQPGSLPRYFVAETFRRHGNLDAAEPLFMELLAQPREVCPQALHLSVARLHIKQGDRLNAEHDYWKAVQELRTELGAGILFEDLKYIVSDRELEYFGSLVSVDAKRDFFRSFWNFRNPSLALKTNLRLQEHIRRYVVAEEEYEYYGFRTRFNNPDNLNELAFPKSFALNEEFNDKGLIYLRQGDPDDIVRHSYSPYDDDEAKERWMKLGGNNIKEFRDFADVRLDRYNHAQKEPYESWLYSPTTESPKMIFHFQKHNTAGNNWRLTACPTYDPMIDELKLWDSRYQRIYDAEETDRAILETQVKTESKALVDYALTTEKHTWEKKTETFRFAHSIDVFRAPDGRSLLDIS